MIVGSDSVEADSPNHPLAVRMAVIALLMQNMGIGCMWGSYSVLLSAVEMRLGVTRELSALAVPIVTLATAGCAPIVGMIVTRYSLRMLMLVGAVLSFAGYCLLAATSSYAMYLVAFGLLIGPGMAAGVVLPSVLVTRWFTVHRGRVLGIVCAPVVAAVVPLLSVWALQTYGLTFAYGLLTALSAICVIANLFIVDRPPGSAAAVSGAPAGTAAGQGTLSVLQLLSSPRLWALTIPAAACATGAIVLTSQMIPIVRAWGISPMLAASLLTICSLMGIVGTLVFGWVADLLGGPATMALLVLDGAILWFLLLLKPPYPVAVVLIGLWGLHGAGILPVLAMSLSEAFGRDNFGRAYGLGQLLNLPFGVLCVPVAALIYSHTGSYSGAIIVQAIFFLIGVPLALSARPRRGAAVAVA